MADLKPDDEILLAHDKEDDSVKVVKGVDKKGNLQTVDPGKENSNEFLRVNKHDDPLENFLSNFKRQLNNPTRFNLFRTRFRVLDTAVKSIQNSIEKEKIQNEIAANKNKQNTKPQNQNSMEIQTPADEQKKYRFNPEKINWDSLSKFGITREKLSDSTLETLLKGGKSEELHRISADLGRIKLHTEARLSLRNMPDGSVALAVHGIRKQPELDRAFFGYQFSEEDKKNLLETGNMGRQAVTRDYRTGEESTVYISLDKLTNDIVSVKASNIWIPEEIKGVKLEKEQKQALQEGKAVWVEGMTSKNGKAFSAYVQVNADKRGLEFRFGHSPKQEQSKEKGNEVTIPQKMGGVELSKDQQGDLRSGKTVYIENMTDKKGEQYSAYVKVDAQKGKLAFYAHNPDIAQREGKTKDIKPDNQHKTQVKANNEGSKSETNKKVNESFKKGQNQPLESQQEKPAKPAKSKGRKL